MFPSVFVTWASASRPAPPPLHEPSRNCCSSSGRKQVSRHATISILEPRNGTLLAATRRDSTQAGHERAVLDLAVKVRGVPHPFHSPGIVSALCVPSCSLATFSCNDLQAADASSSASLFSGTKKDGLRQPFDGKYVRFPRDSPKRNVCVLTSRRPVICFIR